VKTLYIDIESSPNVAHVWGLFRQTVSLSQLQESTRMISFAAKWKGSKKVYFYSEFHSGQRAMLTAAHELLSEADVVVTYNGKGYDIPNLNREFVLAKMVPPAPFMHVDLLQTIRRKFRFASTKLAHVTKQLGLNTKVENGGHMLWVRCMAGDPKAWAIMRRYNRQDVVILEELHDRVLPWTVGQPNSRLMFGDGCPVCGSEELVKEGFAYTSLGKYQRFHCRDCGGWSKSSRREDGTTVRALS
jgi:hypothetical protein